MNDRFRFRAWDKQDKELIYEAENTYDCQSYNGHTIWHDNFACLLDDEERYIVEQCTGLKDKNGRLIYEGDILKDHRQEGGIVKWNNDSAGFAVYEILETGFFVGGLFDWLDKDTNYEVIGNIHENPELLEDK